MVNIFRSFRLNTLCLCGTLIIFPISTVPQLHAFPSNQKNVGFNNIAFGFKIEKLIEKINKYKDKRDSNKLLETMIELKVEVEGRTGQKINLDKQLDQIEKDIKKDGGKFKKEEFNKIRKIIKDKEKRSNHRAMYMADCIAYGIEYNAEVETLNFMAGHGHDKDEEKEEVVLPIRVTIGVTVALCGLFLMFVPFPICQTYGPNIMRAGVALAVEGTLNRVEKDQDKIREKNQ